MYVNNQVVCYTWGIVNVLYIIELYAVNQEYYRWFVQEKTRSLCTYRGLKHNVFSQPMCSNVLAFRITINIIMSELGLYYSSFFFFSILICPFEYWSSPIIQQSDDERVENSDNYSISEDEILRRTREWKRRVSTYKCCKMLNNTHN